MKKFSLILCVFIVLGLCACSPLSEKANPSQDISYPAKVDTTDGPADWIMTDYYHLSVPGDWLLNCVYTSQEQKDGGHILDIYEKESYFDFGGGLLWSVRLFPEGEDFTGYPNHTAYGILETGDQSYYVVVLTPTDEQYTKETKAQYDKMFSQLESIMDTLQPKNSYKYYIPQLENISPVIETDYYSLTLPAKWLDKCIWEITDSDNGTYALNLYELTSHEAMDAGKLCSIILLPTSEDWADFPDYTIHGILYTPEGDYQVIALYPTDVQFDENTAEAYNALFEQISDVLCTLSPAPGLEMVAPAPVLP